MTHEIRTYRTPDGNIVIEKPRDLNVTPDIARLIAVFALSDKKEDCIVLEGSGTIVMET